MNEEWEEVGIADEEWEEVKLPTRAQPKAKKKGDWIDYINGLAGATLQGVIPGAEEIDATSAGFGSLLGGRGYSAGYDQRRDEARAENTQFAEENPYTAMGATTVGAIGSAIAGGAALKAAQVPFLTAALAGPKAGAGVLSNSLRGLSSGGITGAAYGFGAGEGGLENRTGSAVVGSALGGALGGAVPFATQSLGAGIKGARARFGTSQLGNEAGAILPEGVVAPESLSPAELKLLKRLENVATPDIESINQEMARALVEGTPLFLGDAGSDVGAPALRSQAKWLTQHKGSSKEALGALRGRAKGAGDRITGILDDLSPERDVNVGGQSLMSAVAAKADELRGIRTDAAEDFYKLAQKESPLIDQDAVNRVMLNNQKLDSALREVRKFPQFANLPNESRELLHRAKMEIDKKIALAETPTDRADYGYVKNQLLDLLERVDLPESNVGSTQSYGVTKQAFGPSPYGAGRGTFAEQSAPLNELQSGPFGGFLQENTNPDYVGGRVLGMTPTRLRQGIEQLGDAGPVRDAARAGMQQVVRSKSPTSNIAGALVDKPMQRELLAALMGDDASAGMLRKLDLEDRISRLSREYYHQSGTAQNLMEQADFEGSQNVVSQLLAALKSPTTTIAGLIDKARFNPNDELARALAGIHYNTQAGADAMRRVTPYALERNAIAAQYDPLIAALTQGVSGGSRSALMSALQQSQD